ncbi:hypothetical protein A9Q99_06700 [Gammaproteobacteria bacterium 45_16_T64]|nr:hypothetical protein A9Q99_06700 [Gammaproteobacteria bacterium 45_16_T64]
MEQQYIERLLTFVSGHASLTDQNIAAFLGLFRQLRFVPKQHIVTPSVERSTLFFMCTGCARYYYLAENGKEWNKAFVSEGMMSTSFAADFLGSPSPYGIQALEDTVLLMASYEEFEALYDDHPMIERLGRKLVELVLISKMKRERSFLQDSALMRYHDFVAQNPGILGRISKFHLASYLGITESSLSRLRADQM